MYSGASPWSTISKTRGDTSNPAAAPVSAPAVPVDPWNRIDRLVTALDHEEDIRSRFGFVRVLGRGESARVVLATPSSGGQQVALKIFEKEEAGVYAPLRCLSAAGVLCANPVR